MNKIWLIIKREYLTRVQKKSFLVMTILGPLLMAGIMIVPVWIATKSDQKRTVAVVDESFMYIHRLQESENMKFVYLSENIDTLKKSIADRKYDAILHIPQPSETIPTYARLYAETDISIMVKEYIQAQLRIQAEQLRLMKSGIDQKILDDSKVKIFIDTIKLRKGVEEKGDPVLSTAIGMIGGILIYFFIFMFGAQVMRGVIEEKTSRIVEVIVSSVRPFQLMMGKIIGVALVGLTQFLLWVLLTTAIVGFVQSSFSDTLEVYAKEQMAVKNTNNIFPDQGVSQLSDSDLNAVQLVERIKTINFPLMLGSFLFFFLFGYLMYAAIFAGIGGAVDNEADTQQFMLPITVPLIISIVVAQFIAVNPHGPVAFWFSIIPLTSPISMMIRLPFGVPAWELLLSMGLLILGFLGMVWMAGKIYRTGILLYGKKVTYKELWKWLRYSS